MLELSCSLQGIDNLKAKYSEIKTYPREVNIYINTLFNYCVNAFFFKAVFGKQL